MVVVVVLRDQMYMQRVWRIIISCFMPIVREAAMKSINRPRFIDDTAELPA
jgi:hypothetical protein